MRASASAPGKCILFGEHFVVYGKPAVVMAIDKRVYVDVEERGDRVLRIHSDLGLVCEFTDGEFKPVIGGAYAERILKPVKITVEEALNWIGERRGLNLWIRSEVIPSAGLGSSAAISVATAAAVLKLFNVEVDEETLFKLSHASEKFMHVHPSGVDQTIAISGGVIKYVKGEGVTRLRVRGKVPLIIGDTGVSRNTGELVSKVRRFRDENPDLMGNYLEEAEEVVGEAVKALKDGNLVKLGELMDENQELLVKIGVSHPKLDKLISEARRVGAIGAKLTGAGGGGCMIALAEEGKLGVVEEAIRRAGGRTLRVKSIGKGALGQVA